MAKQRRWLSVIEYIAVAGSFAGSIAAVVFQQMIYGLAPISLSLLLNLINRPRSEQKPQQSVPVNNVQLQQLRGALDSLRSANAQMKQDLQNLTPKQELAPLSLVENLNQQHSSLRQSLVPLQSQLDDLKERFNKRPELEQIESLTTIIVALKRCIDDLPQPERLQLHSAELQHQFDQAFAQLSQNSKQIGYLEQAIAQLQQQLLDS